MYLPDTRWCMASVIPSGLKAEENEWMRQRGRRVINHVKDNGIPEDEDRNRHVRPIWGVTTPEPKGLVGYKTC